MKYTDKQVVKKLKNVKGKLEFDYHFGNQTEAKVVKEEIECLEIAISKLEGRK